MTHLCEFYLGICICLTTEEKVRKRLSQCSRRVTALHIIYYQNTETLHKLHTHIHKHKHTHYKTHTYTHTHTHTHTPYKQYKTTTVQIKTNTIEDIPKLNSHNINKYPQYKVTLMYEYIAPLSTRTLP